MLEQREESGDVSLSISGSATSLDDVKVGDMPLALGLTSNDRPRCKYCLQSFASNGTLKIHVRDQHGEKPGELKHIPCLERGCDFYGRYIDDLIKHLQARHGQQFTVENRTFQSRNEFEVWKKNEEDATHFSYISISGRHRLAHGDERVYFVCSLSDYFRPRGKRNRRFDGESRSAYCTSKMVFTITPVGSGYRYAVSYTKEHYGHVGTPEAGVANVRSPTRVNVNVEPSARVGGPSFANLEQSGSLSDTERALIALLLERGISANAIVDQLRAAGVLNACTSARFGLATANDMRAALRKELVIAQRALDTCADERSLLSALADLKRAARTLTSSAPEKSVPEEAITAPRNGSKRKPRNTKARRVEDASHAGETGNANQSVSSTSNASGAPGSSSLGGACASSSNLHLSNLMPPTQIQIGSSAYYNAPYHAHPPSSSINWTDFMNI